jgi:hypothetical protein
MVVVGGVLAVGLLSGAPSAVAETGQAIGIAPTQGADGLSAGGNYFSPSVAPGSTFSSSILLANPNSAAVKVNIYASDGMTSAGSGSAYTNEGDAVTGPGTWIHLSSTSLSLPSLSRTTVHFTVVVPAGARPGDHLAGVAVEGIAPSSTSGSGSVRVKILTRSVIGVLIRVPGDATYGMTIGHVGLEVGTYGIGVVSSLLTNTGGLLVRPFVVDRLQGANGYDQSYTRALDTILPGDSTTYKLFWPTTLKGTYTITSCVYGGGLNAKICASGTGTLNAATQTQSHNTGAFAARKAGSGFPVIALVLIIALGGLLLVGGGAFFGVRIAKQRIIAQLSGSPSPPADIEPIDEGTDTTP